MSAEFRWDIQRDQFHIHGDGKYLVTAAGNLQQETHYRGEGTVPSRFTEANDSRVVAVDGQAYVLSPPLGSAWVKFTPQEFNTDWDVVQRLATARSPVAYSSIVTAALDGVTSRGVESINGRSNERYHGRVDANVLMSALADAYGSQGQVMFGNRFFGPVETDVWIDPTTSLPSRLQADGNITFLGGDTHLVLTVDYTDFDSGTSVTAPASFILFKNLGQSQ